MKEAVVASVLLDTLVNNVQSYVQHLDDVSNCLQRSPGEAAVRVERLPIITGWLAELEQRLVAVRVRILVSTQT